MYSKESEYLFVCVINLQQKLFGFRADECVLQPPVVADLGVLAHFEAVSSILVNET